MARREPDWVDTVNSMTAHAKTTLQDCINAVIEEELKRPDITPPELKLALKMKDAVLKRYRDSMPRLSRAAD